MSNYIGAHEKQARNINIISGFCLYGETMVDVVAVVVAGGSGKRMKIDVAKQYLLLGGMPILARTLLTFEKNTSVNAIIVTVPAGDREYVQRDIVEKYAVSKVRHVISGGQMRQDSVRNGLKAIGENPEIVIVHDGVRPFVPDALITEAVDVARVYGAALAAVPVTDTIKRRDDQGFVAGTLRREDLLVVQTPQAFQWRILKKAYERAYDDAFYGTDDGMLVERLGVKIKIVKGFYDNIKITTEEDLRRGELILSHRHGQA